MHLQELQGLFQRSVLEGRSGIEAELIRSEDEDFPARLAVYTEGYRSRLLEALETTYPGVKAALGNAEFERTMRQFIEDVPSRHYSIRYYGETLSEFIRATRTESGAEALQDLARWEWVLADVFDAPDDAPIGSERLAAIGPESWPLVTFALRASLRSVAISSNAVQWWRWAREGGVKPSALECAPATSWRLWRQGIRTMFRSMNAAESAALAVASAGGTFGEICEVIAREVGDCEAPLRAASILNGWFADEIIASLAVVPSETR
jgi:Putative DNA-binding domain